MKHVYSETIVSLYSVFLEFEISKKYLEAAGTNQEVILSYDKSLHDSKLRVLWDVYFILADKLCKIKIGCFKSIYFQFKLFFLSLSHVIKSFVKGLVLVLASLRALSIYHFKNEIILHGIL